MNVFTYEYVTIHLITDNAEMEEVLEPLLGVRRVGGPRSPTVGIDRQLETNAWVWMKEKRARNPYS